MYVYLDKKGVVKEIINDEALRQSSNNANAIYVYFDGYQEDGVSSVLATYELPDGTILPEAEVATKTEMSEIPYNAERDLKFFEYYTDYPFYVFKVADSALAQSGVVRLTLRMVCQDNTAIKAQGLICFNVEAEAVQADYDMSLSQYNYLVKQWKELDLAKFVQKQDNNSFTGENQFTKSVYVGEGTYEKPKSGMKINSDGTLGIWDSNGNFDSLSYLPKVGPSDKYYLAFSTNPTENDPNLARYLKKDDASDTYATIVDLNNEKTAREANDTITLNSAKTYADMQDEKNLNSAKAYTDSKVGSIDLSNFADVTKDVSFKKNVTVAGNLTVSGTFTKVNAETISTKNHTIGLALGNTASIADYLGFYATKYDGTHDGALAFDNTGTAYVGDAVVDANGKITDGSNMQPLLTRSEASALSDEAILFWDADSSKAVQETGWNKSALGSIKTKAEGSAQKSGNNAFTGDNSFSKYVTFTADKRGAGGNVKSARYYKNAIELVHSDDTTDWFDFPINKSGTLALTSDIPSLTDYAKKADVPTLVGDNNFTNGDNHFESGVTAGSIYSGIYANDDYEGGTLFEGEGGATFSQYNEHGEKTIKAYVPYTDDAIDAEYYLAYSKVSMEDADLSLYAKKTDLASYVTLTADNAFTGTNTFTKGIVAKEDTTSTTDTTTYNGNHISRVRLSKVGGTSASYNYALPDKSGTFMLKEELLDTIYPVGCIYISTTSTSPASFMPNTTWEKIEGKFLIGSSISYPLGTTGGEATHTLTADEMPSHSHGGNSYLHSVSFGETSSLPYKTSYIDLDKVVEDSVVIQWNTTPIAVEHTTTFNDAPTSETGGNLAHNNIPPYLSVSIWKRTK